MPVSFQIIAFALIAAVLLFALYNVLGKKVGIQPGDVKPKTKAGAGFGRAATPATPATTAVPAIDPVTAAAIAGLKARDPSFDPARFLEGARQAYETIVRAYATGDRETLRPLLSRSVLTSFESGIDAREARGEREQVEFIIAPRADLEEATVRDERAVAKVRFLAELRSTHTPAEGEPVVDERRTAEVWTFERALGAADPNWALARVEAATA